MRIIGCLLVIGILFSYVPIIPMDDCPDENHMGNLKMDCGFLFHCPMVVDINISETLYLPINGRLVSKEPLLVVKELANPIFRPPKHLNEDFIPLVVKGKIQLSEELWHKNC